MKSADLNYSHSTEVWNSLLTIGLLLVNHPTLRRDLLPDQRQALFPKQNKGINQHSKLVNSFLTDDSFRPLGLKGNYTRYPQNICLFVWVKALCPSQQFFSHVRTLMKNHWKVSQNHQFLSF